ncbi:hypothetical protein B0O80DRAFT_424671 [Mortierella sp. GBAus27b]|nr:hypothetical protein B0O80DRAFT_424671 [Mortierella sp. GBAus27b]
MALDRPGFRRPPCRPPWMCSLSHRVKAGPENSLLVLLQLGLIIYTLTRHYKVDDILDLAWQKAYDHEPRILQDLETSRGCCGYSSVGDRAIPKSSKYACRDSPAFGYDTSCQRQLRQSFLRHENTILGLVAGVQFLQLLALASAMLLWAHLPSDDQIEEQYRGEHSQRLLQGLREEDQQQGQPYRTSETLNGQGQYGATDNQPR